MKARTLGIIAAAGLAALVGCKEKADAREWQGTVDVFAPACNNNPFVHFKLDKENGDVSYSIRCGDYAFFHELFPKTEETSCRDTLRSDITLSMMTDEYCDGNGFDTWSAGMDPNVYTHETASPSLYDDYDEGITTIGKEEIEAKFLRWILNY
ncbi:MAG: hypothetical protein WC852_00330 [Candidatus Nanoarchaeia archaeon]|jgi:hypothetical protein